MSMTLVQAWAGARKRLEAAGVDSPVIDARLLLQAAAEASRTDIVTDPYRELSPAQEAALEDFLTRREGREPVSHILGRKGFWTIELKVTPDVLTPRPETEVIVDFALKTFAHEEPLHLLDLGTGPGTILLAILAERPTATGVGLDISTAALEVARENAALLGVEDRVVLAESDWAEGQADEAYDLVVSNPPYIAREVIAGLDPEVRDHEPHLALDGGPDGLDAYRIIAPQVLRTLKPGGLFALEIGYDQSAAVEALMQAAGGQGVRTLKDLSDKDRVVIGSKKPLGKPEVVR
jgi:release factor glutamine methyltransferase